MHREQRLTSIIATHNPRLAATCDRACGSRKDGFTRSREDHEGALVGWGMRRSRRVRP